VCAAVVRAQRCGAPDGGDDVHGSADDAPAVDPIKASGASHRCRAGGTFAVLQRTLPVGRPRRARRQPTICAEQL
jgi:hypothetical protein